MNQKTKKLTLSGVCLALCLVLPFLTGQIPEIGSALSPMHIPVLLCGFICGWPYALAVGFIAPLLRFALFGMPPIFPTGISMAFELAAYGVLAAVFYRKLPRKTANIYVSLILAMLGGRIVWGLVRTIMALLFHVEFGFSMFLTAGFITAIPGIICHIVLIPLIVIGLRRAHLIED